MRAAAIAPIMLAALLIPSSSAQALSEGSSCAENHQYVGEITPAQGVGYNHLGSSVRVLDTRSGFGTADGRSCVIGSGKVTEIDPLLNTGLDSSQVGAVVVNVTATDALGDVEVSLFPGGTNPDSSVDVAGSYGGHDSTNLNIVPLGLNGKIAIKANGADTDIVVDVIGYMNNDPSALKYTQLPLNLRNSVQVNGRTSVALDIDGAPADNGGSVPIAGNELLLANVTAKNPMGDSFVALSADGSHSDNRVVSTHHDGISSNQAIISNSQQHIYSYRDSQVNIADTGKFSPSGNSLYYPLSAPTNVLDTRNSQPGPLPGLQAGLVSINVSDSVPGDVDFVVLSATLENTQNDNQPVHGYLSLDNPNIISADRVTQALTTSPMRKSAGTIVAPVDESGNVSVHLSVAADLVVDVQGYFSDGVENGPQAPVPGVYAGSFQDGAANTAIDAFENDLGVDVGVVAEYSKRDSWANIVAPSWQTDHIRQRDEIVEYGVAPFPTDGGSLAQCASGDYNDKWTMLGSNLVNSGLNDTILKFGWNFNASWYQWSAQGKEQQFIDCYREFVDTTRAVPGNQFKYTWSPHNAYNAVDAVNAWPGSNYVDYVGVNAYDVRHEYYVVNRDRGPGEAAVPMSDEQIAGPEGDARRAAAWEDVMNSPRGVQFWSNFAENNNVDFALSEWGMWGNKSYAGEDNPEFVNKMATFINNPDNNVHYHNYYNADSTNSKHSISSGTTFPQGASKYRETLGDGQSIALPVEPEDLDLNLSTGVSNGDIVDTHTPVFNLSSNNASGYKYRVDRTGEWFDCEANCSPNLDTGDVTVEFKAVNVNGELSSVTEEREFRVIAGIDNVRPSASTTGLPLGIDISDLTVVDTLKMDVPGKTYENYYVKGIVHVKAPGVTLKNSIVMGNEDAGAPPYSMGAIRNGYDQYDAHISDVTIEIKNPTPHWDGIQGKNISAERVDISRAVDGMAFYDNNELKNSYVHDLVYFTQNNGWVDVQIPSHNDGIQVHGGSNHKITNNNMVGASNAAIQVVPHHSKPDINGLLIEGNFLDGGSCTVNIHHNGRPVSGIVMTDNRFGRNNVGGCAASATAQSNVSHSGNVWDDNNTPINVRNG